MGIEPMPALRGAAAIAAAKRAPEGRIAGARRAHCGRAEGACGAGIASTLGAGRAKARCVLLSGWTSGHSRHGYPKGHVGGL